MYWIIRWVVHALILMLVVALGQALGIGIKLSGFWDAAIVVVVLALANTFIRPVLKLLLFPLNCLTLGLVGFAVNVLMVWLVSRLVGGFEIQSIWAAIYASVMLSLLGAVANQFIGKAREE